MEAQYLLLTCPKYLLHMIPLIPEQGYRQRICSHHMPITVFNYIDLSSCSGGLYSMNIQEDFDAAFKIQEVLYHPFLMPDKCLVQLSEFDFDNQHLEISFEMRKINEPSRV